MSKRATICAVVLMLMVTSGVTYGVPLFNNPNYTYTQVWSADDAGYAYGRWPVYSSSSYGNILV